MGLLFTREFFSQARKRLNSGGVMLAWIGIYDLDVDSFRMIARTFIDVFPDATLWEVLLGSDYVFVGGTESLRLDYSELKKLYNNPQISSELAFVKIGQPEQFISRLIMGPKELREFAASGSLHSDDRRQLELQVPRNTYLQTREQNILPALKALRELSSNPREYLSFGNQSDEKDLPAIESYWSERLKVMDAFMLTEKQQEY
jgi:spermidine synthase